MGSQVTKFTDIDQHRALARYPDLVEAMRDRAARGNWPLPTTPADFMAWFIDEVNVQLDQAMAAEPLEEAKSYVRCAYAYDLAVKHLAEVGVTPSMLPWQTTTETHHERRKR